MSAGAVCLQGWTVIKATCMQGAPRRCLWKFVTIRPLRWWAPRMAGWGGCSGALGVGSRACSAVGSPTSTGWRVLVLSNVCVYGVVCIESSHVCVMCVYGVVCIESLHVCVIVCVYGVVCCESSHMCVMCIYGVVCCESLHVCVIRLHMVFFISIHYKDVCVRVCFTCSS